ncbi:MAG TPA: type II TA system antitoxin MqsA family protein [Gemmataceae bacterium]|nr:type II TA system antitoxin MqsA family protein [Gemmataceae bacterium]
MEQRIFSKRCGNCGQRTMEISTVDYTTRYDLDGCKYDVHVADLSVPKCTNCGTLSFDRDANLRLDAEFRKQLGLLSPEEIRTNREELGLSQQQLADLIGTSIHSLARWEAREQIQQRTLDKMLRLVFFTPDARAALERNLQPVSVPTSLSFERSIDIR